MVTEQPMDRADGSLQKVLRKDRATRPLEAHEALQCLEWPSPQKAAQGYLLPASLDSDRQIFYQGWSLQSNPSFVVSRLQCCANRREKRPHAQEGGRAAHEETSRQHMATHPDISEEAA